VLFCILYFVFFFSFSFLFYYSCVPWERHRPRRQKGTG